MTEPSDDLLRVFERWANPPAELVNTLPRKSRSGGTIALRYMGHAAVTRALIESDPAWSWEPVRDDDGVPRIVRNGSHLTLWGTLTVHGKTLPCCGTCEATKAEPEKELIGDLLRNGAMRFGIGLSLWSKDEWNAGGDTVEPAPSSSPQATVPVSPPAADTDPNRARVNEARAQMTAEQRGEIQAFMAKHGITLARGTADDIARLADECDRLLERTGQ